MKYLSDLSLTRDLGLEVSKLALIGLGLGLAADEEILFCLFLFIFWPFVLDAAVPDLFTMAPEGFISIVLKGNKNMFKRSSQNIVKAVNIYELFFSASTTLATLSLVA